MNPFLLPRTIHHRRSWGQRLVLGFNLLLITACLLAAGSLGYGAQRAASVNRVALDRSLTALPGADGESRVINILLVGSDSSANLDPDDPIQVGRHGERLGDVIIVAHLDERDGTVSLLSFPRDLWVPIAGTERSDRINRAFVIGGPGTLIDTIEENFGIPIHHYVNVDFAGFQGLVEAVGTVEIYFDSPARDWNANAKPEPRSQTGFLVTEAGCQSLGPEQALAYVRSRYYQVQNADGVWVTDPTSDLGRIRRQQDFLERLLQKSIDLGARNPLVLRDLIDTGIQNVAIDGQLTPGLLIDLSGTYRNFDPGDLQSFTFPVQDATIGSNRVLVPRLDDAAPLMELFAGAPNDDPATVAVRVVHDPALNGPTLIAAGDRPEPYQPVVDIVDALLDAGFDLDGDRAEGGGAAAVAVKTKVVEPGLWISYGPGGRQAAGLVARALQGATSQPRVIREVGGLPARTVEVAVGPEVTPTGPAAFAGDTGEGPGPVPVREGPGSDIGDGPGISNGDDLLYDGSITPAPGGSSPTADPGAEDEQSRPGPRACSQHNP